VDKGVAVIVAAVVGGVAVDHFGWLGVERSPITVAKVAGVALLALGTWLVIRD
jgi:bacterial/archaeal transporter family-2 protein